MLLPKAYGIDQSSENLKIFYIVYYRYLLAIRICIIYRVSYTRILSYIYIYIYIVLKV